MTQTVAIEKIPVKKLKLFYCDLLDRAEHGESFLLTKKGKPWVKFTPIKAKKSEEI